MINKIGEIENGRVNYLKSSNKNLTYATTIKQKIPHQPFFALENRSKSTGY